jgi:hypothetical protein
MYIMHCYLQILGDFVSFNTEQLGLWTAKLKENGSLCIFIIRILYKTVLFYNLQHISI